MHAIVLGPDRGIAAALESEGVETTRLAVATDAEALVEAGVEDADLFVLTDVEEATVVAVAKDCNPEIRAVVYSPDTIPEFVRGQVTFALSPDVMDAEVVAEELAAARQS